MGGLEWINLAQDLDKWQAVVSTVVNLQIHTVWGDCWTAKELLACEGLCCL